MFALVDEVTPLFPKAKLRFVLYYYCNALLVDVGGVSLVQML